MSGAIKRIGAGRACALAIALALLLWLTSSSVWTVRQNEHGVVLRFSRVARVVPAGMHFTLPWPFETLVRVPTTEQLTMPIGFKLIDAAMGRPTPEEERQWLTGDTNIVELRASLLYDVSDPVEYLFGTSDTSDGATRNFVLRKLCEAALTRIVATLSIDEVLSSGKQELSRRALQSVREELGKLKLGLAVKALNITEISPPADVIGAFNDVTTARADRARRRTEADGYERRILPRARAAAQKSLSQAESYAHSVESEARGTAQAFGELAEEIRKNPDIGRRQLWLSALSRILSKIKTQVIGAPPDGERIRVYVED